MSSVTKVKIHVRNYIFNIFNYITYIYKYFTNYTESAKKMYTKGKTILKLFATIIQFNFEK